MRVKRRIVKQISDIKLSANGNWYYSRVNNFDERIRIDFPTKLQAMVSRELDMDKYVIEGLREFPLNCVIPTMKNLTKSKSFLK